VTPRVWAAAGVAAAALAIGAAHLPSAVHSAYTHATTSYGSGLQRDLQPTYYPQPYLFRLAVALRRHIPRDATYAVVVGDGPTVPDIVREGLPQLLEYALLPRRYAADVTGAQYIVTWDHPSETLGVPVKRELGLSSDANLVQVRR